MQGAAVGGISAVVYSYVPLLFPQNSYVAVSYLEMSVGVGMSVGTLLGTLLSEWLSGPYMVFILMGLVYPVVNYLLIYSLPET